MPIPSAYHPANWHCTTKVDPITQEIGIGLIRPDGEVIRVRLAVADAWNLADSLTEYLQETPQKGAETPFCDQVLSELSAIRRELRLRA
jgi:hypothetical protein